MRKTITLFMLMLFSSPIISGQSSADKNNPVGKWKFEAPFAPEGYNSGIIEFSLIENKYSTTISFTGSDYKIPGDKTKVENDTVSFTVLVEGNEVTVGLKTENETKMTGKAVYIEGEIPVILTRELPQK